jgi:hypothetical protein
MRSGIQLGMSSGRKSRNQAESNQGNLIRPYGVIPMAVGFPPMRPYSHFVVNFPMPASEAGGYRRDATVMWVVWAWRLRVRPGFARTLKKRTSNARSRTVAQFV